MSNEDTFAQFLQSSLNISCSEASSFYYAISVYESEQPIPFEFSKNLLLLPEAIK